LRAKLGGEGHFEALPELLTLNPSPVLVPAE
jgi:hypothetical protein